jgi:hypothetical protein
VDRDIQNAEHRVTAQLLHIADLRRDGRSTARAEERLRTILESVQALKAHRQFVRDRIASKVASS